MFSNETVQYEYHFSSNEWRRLNHPWKPSITSWLTLSSPSTTLTSSLIYRWRHYHRHHHYHRRRHLRCCCFIMVSVISLIIIAITMVTVRRHHDPLSDKKSAASSNKKILSSLLLPYRSIAEDTFPDGSCVVLSAVRCNRCRLWFRWF